MADEHHVGQVQFLDDVEDVVGVTLQRRVPLGVPRLWIGQP
jgi:hypothetical protein